MTVYFCRSARLRGFSVDRRTAEQAHRGRARFPRPAQDDTGREIEQTAPSYLNAAEVEEQSNNA